MFQPQPIYFSDIPYGTTSQPPLSQSQYSYDQILNQQQGPQQQQLRQNNTARSGGPITFDTPTFSNTGAPTGLWGNIGQSIPQPQLQQRRIQRQQYDHITNIIPKMEAEDYEAQQALAGGYAPKLEVSSSKDLTAGCAVVPVVGDRNSTTGLDRVETDTTIIGSISRGEEEQSCDYGRICEGRPSVCRED